MVKANKIILYLLVLLGLCSHSLADWTFYKNTQVSNKDRHILRFDRLPSGKIRTWIDLKDKIPELSTKKPPLYQVDENEVHDLESIKDLRIYKRDGNYNILWEIYSGQGPLSKALLEFMNGREVTFQYYLPDGTIKETTFDLKGARKAIEEILR